MVVCQGQYLPMHIFWEVKYVSVKVTLLKYTVECRHCSVDGFIPAGVEIFFRRPRPQSEDTAHR